MSRVDTTMPGVWRELFPHALKLMAHLERQTIEPPWTFGGGTVLMLRLGHRQSKDIDLFVPDPQYLGYVNPRLSDVAEEISHDYDENAEYVKLFLPAGEIDIVVGTPLTPESYELVQYGDRKIRVETSAEIIAKKMWHRGHYGKARDLFDLAAVAEAEPEAIMAAQPFMARHGAAFLQRLQSDSPIARLEFESIDVIGFTKTFDECLEIARMVVRPALDS